MPPTLEISREDLTQIGLEQKPLNQQFDWARFPLILRPVDSHGGKNLEHSRLFKPSARCSILFI